MVESRTTKAKVKLSNIQEKFPLSSILRKTLIVNACDMTMINNEERHDASLKSRQTARKSTNSKLKQISTNILDTLSGDIVDEIGSSSEYHGKSTTEFVSTEPRKSTLVSQSNADAAREDEIAVLSSKILTDNKIKIVSKKSNFKSTSSTLASPVSKGDDMDVLPVKSKRKCLSDRANDSSPNPKEPVQSRKTEKQPIKLLLSTINGVSTVQQSSSKHASNFTAADAQHEPSTTENQSSVSLSSNQSSTADSNLKTSPLKIVQNGNLEVVKNSANKKQKSSIESVVQNLSSNKVSTKKEANRSESTPNLKRQSSDHSDSETVCKKTKSSVSETASKCSNGGTCTKDATTSKNNKHIVKTENKEDKFKTAVNSFLSKKDIQPNLEKLVKEAVCREVDLRIKLERKNDQYEKLKEKYESVERNFQSWIEFANKLQARIKKVALALHKQQTIVKMIQSKGVATRRSVLCQTDLVQRQNPVANDIKSPPAQPPEMKKPIQNTPSNAIFQTVPGQGKTPPSKNLPSPKAVSKPHGDIIDLTNENEAAVLNKGEKRLTSVNLQSSVSHQMLVRHPQKPQPKQVVAGPSANRNSQTGVFHRMLGTTPLSYPSNPSGVCGTVPTKYVPIIPKSALGSNAVCYGDQAMVYQNQPIASTHTVHSNNTACRTIPGQLIGRPPQSQLPMQKKTPMKNLPYPPLPSAPPAIYRIPPKALGPPPKLLLAIKQNNGGIVLSWSNLYPNAQSAEVKGYELYAFQENSKSEKKEWRKIGEDTITAMDLPMACTLTQFSSSFVYYFAVRGKDVFGRFGPFSEPCTSKDLFT